MLIPLVLLFMLALVASLALLALARELRVRTGLPFRARVVYSDTGAWTQVERPLFSSHYGLTGKADYIVEDAGAVIPVEVKPNRTAPAPHDSDVMQLAAYGLLIEDVYGKMPPYGLLKYRDAVFQVNLTSALRSGLEGLIDTMRRDLDATDVLRSHAEAPRCRACGYRDACGQ
jgi:CRISPR-associated exonuclease Cas4